MRIDVLTLFPKMFENILGESMLRRAQVKGLLEIAIHDLRDWTCDSHHSADDKPFGGGPGMVMKVEPVWEALRELKALRTTNDEPRPRSKGRGRRRTTRERFRVILLTPQGRKFDQKIAKELSKEKRLILICGHYEGVDERIRSFVDDEISIGDYVLTCGEIPALVLIDSVVRLVRGVLGDDGSLKSESFEDDMLEYPQYTRPADFRGRKVPQVLLSGDHKRMEEWRRKEAIKRTQARRPDLLKTQNSKRKTQNYN